MTKYLSIAILITGFLVGNAYGDIFDKEPGSIFHKAPTTKPRIADVYFDDGSELHNTHIKFPGVIQVKYENDYFKLLTSDIATLNINVRSSPSKNLKLCVEEAYGSRCETFHPAAIVTLKIKTKTGVEFKSRFTNGIKIKDLLCDDRGVALEVMNKLTGRKIVQNYGFTNLTRVTIGDGQSIYPSSGCLFHKGKRKAIKSIVFKE